LCRCDAYIQRGVVLAMSCAASNDPDIRVLGTTPDDSVGSIVGIRLRG